MSLETPTIAGVTTFEVARSNGLKWSDRWSRLELR